MRSVPEWRGETDDSTVPKRVRLRIWERFEGICQCGCMRKIVPGERWELDHAIALINGGEHCESNLRPLLYEHHKKKSRDDNAMKSYNYKRRLARAGIKQSPRRPMFGTKASGWKVTFNRGPVRR